MVVKILSRYDDKFAATFFTGTFFFIKLMFADTVFFAWKIFSSGDCMTWFFCYSKWDYAAAASLHFNGRRREEYFSNFDP